LRDVSITTQLLTTHHEQGVSRSVASGILKERFTNFVKSIECLWKENHIHTIQLGKTALRREEKVYKTSVVSREDSNSTAKGNYVDNATMEQIGDGVNWIELIQDLFQWWESGAHGN
jgi:hypothetical protein